MTISLVKGQKIDLTKGKEGLTNLLIGLGWDPVERKSKGFFGLLGGSSTSDLDADASAFLVDAKGKLVETIYYGNLNSSSGSVRHTGDNLTGEGEGDDEQIIVNLNKVPSHVERIVFTVNIYSARSRRQDFGMVENAYIHVQDMDSKQGLARFNLTDDYGGRTAIFVGEIYRHNGEWRFSAVGEGTSDGSIREMSKRFK